jgi:hypothetical protein
MMRDAMRAMAVLCVLSSPMGCQLIRRLTNRGQDAGATAPTTPLTPTPVEVDAGPIAVPNPTVAPMPTTDDAAAPTPPPTAEDVPAVDVAPAPAAPTVEDAGAPTAAPPPPVAPTPTVADPVPSTEPRRRGGPRNYCKDHPGRVNPATGEVCPIVNR